MASFMNVDPVVAWNILVKVVEEFFARCIKDCPVAPNQTILREERIALRHKIGKLDTEVA